jgi:hypothetical protein
MRGELFYLRNNEKKEIDFALMPNGAYACC